MSSWVLKKMETPKILLLIFDNSSKFINNILMVEVFAQNSTVKEEKQVLVTIFW